MTEISNEIRDELTLLNVLQVCELLNVKKDWLYDEVAAERIPHVKLGRAIRFRPAELSAWITSGMKAATNG